MTPSLLNFAPCRHEGCDNYLIAQVSQDDGQCRQCAATHDRDMAYYGALYRAAKAKGTQTPPQAPEGLSGPPSAPTGHSRGPCPTCQHPDGSPNTDYLSAEGSCTFGCGAKIDMDHGMCGHCREHSANEVECETCGKTWADWDAGKWEAV